MSRLINFGAGPAALPEALLTQAQAELLDWQGQGMSVMEISHRSQAYQDMQAQTIADLRDVLNIPDHYKVLLLSGPTRAQFAMIPFNLMGAQGCADYIDTGIWSRMAWQEAEKYGDARLAASGKEQHYTLIPQQTTWSLNPKAAYVHYTDNETVNGVEFSEPPSTGDVSLVTDMTSNILSRPVDVSRFGLIYAGSQKNIAPAGLTIVIIREDLLDRALPSTPTVFHYKKQAEQDSLYYTPCAFSCYFAGLMFRWVKAQGGVAAMAERSQRKAALLYDCIDKSDFYHNPIEPAARSRMNIPFTLANSELDAHFLEQSRAAGLAALKGHRFIGGMRASIYNALDEADVKTLVDFMREFERTHA